MKRYEPDLDFHFNLAGCSCCPPASVPYVKMEEHEYGNWVRWEDVEKLIKEAKNENPDTVSDQI